MDDKKDSVIDYYHYKKSHDALKQLLDFTYVTMVHMDENNLDYHYRALSDIFQVDKELIKIEAQKRKKEYHDHINSILEED